MFGLANYISPFKIREKIDTICDKYEVYVALAHDRVKRSYNASCF